MNKEQRWRYQDRNGRAIWLAFDPSFPCIYCDESVRELSTGGPAVCPSCDCGQFKGPYQEFNNVFAHARKRLIDLEDDPIWKEYEMLYILQKDDI